MITEIQPLAYQISATLSSAGELEMQMICDEVLLQKSISIVQLQVDEKDMLDCNSDDTDEPTPHSCNRSTKHFQYSQLSVPKKYNHKSNKWTSPKHMHSVIPSDSDQFHFGRLPSITQYNKPYYRKWRALCMDCYFWHRIAICILTLVLLFLSVSYGIKQFLQFEVILTDWKTCTNPTAFETSNSYMHIYKDKYKIENTNDLCWTESEMNEYKYKYNWKFLKQINLRSILYFCVSFYAVIILFYSIISMCRDVYYIKTGQIHTKSRLFKRAQTNEIAIKTYNKCQYLCWLSYHFIHGKQRSYWVLLFAVSELTQFLLQTSVLLLYNGYHILDTNNIYFAENPSFIMLFTGVICGHAFVCGVLWLSYVLAYQYCPSIHIQSLLYFVDVICSLFYALSPIFILQHNHQNEHIPQTLILFGHELNNRKVLNSTKYLLFSAVFVPLLFCCNACVVMLHKSMQKMRDNCYAQWKLTQPQTIQIKSNKAIPKATEKSEQKNIPNLGWMNRISLLILSISFVMYGLYVFVAVFSHFYVTKQYCHSITENTLMTMNGTLTDEQMRLWDTNVELIVYDHCSQKVYPFIHRQDRYSNKCECRELVLDWTNININYTQTQNYLLNAITDNFYMLQTFRSCFSENESANCTLNQFIDDKCDGQCANQYCKSANLAAGFMVQSVILDNDTVSSFEGITYNCTQ